MWLARAVAAGRLSGGRVGVVMVVAMSKRGGWLEADERHEHNGNVSKADAETPSARGSSGYNITTAIGPKLFMSAVRCWRRGVHTGSLALTRDNTTGPDSNTTAPITITLPKVL